MHQERIPFKCPVGIIITQTPDVADLVQILPAFIDCHHTRHAVLNICFIENGSLGQTILRDRGSLIGDHDSNRARGSNIGIHPFIGETTAHHSLGGCHRIILHHDRHRIRKLVIGIRRRSRTVVRQDRTENIIIIVLCAAGGQQQRSGQQKRGGSVPCPFFIIMRNHVKVTSTIIRYLSKALSIKKSINLFPDQITKV